MKKLYMRVEGVLHYHEAWADGRVVYEHWGVVGERGETRKHALKIGQKAGQFLGEVLQPAVEEGYAPIDDEGHATLLIEYAVDGFGTPADLDRRHALEARMNETLGWTGLGACDGGSIGSGMMEVCCFVVDFDIARRVIEADLAGTEFADYTRIYDEEADL